MDLEVLEAIADVDSTESIRVKLVEELVTDPLQRAHHHRLAPLVELQRPRAPRLVLRRRLKETLIERSGREVELGALVLVLNISEMQVVVKAHAVLVGEPSECLVPPHLVFRGHLERSNRTNLTVVFDGVDDSGQAVQLYSGIKGYFAKVDHLPVRGLVGTLTSSSDVSSLFLAFSSASSSSSTSSFFSSSSSSSPSPFLPDRTAWGVPWK